MNLPSELKKDLDHASKIENESERTVLIASIIAEALHFIGQDPVLVGGAAVEFYTQGGYSTADIDMVTEGGSEAIKIMSELGFEKIGKDFIDKRRKIYIEFPSSSLRPGETTQIIKIGKRKLQIISIEDLIVDRLCAYKFWKSALDGVNALLLLELGEAEESYLMQRALKEKVRDAMEVVQWVRNEAIRKRLSKEQANELLETKMKTSFSQ